MNSVETKSLIFGLFGTDESGRHCKRFNTDSNTRDTDEKKNKTKKIYLKMLNPHPTKQNKKNSIKSKTVKNIRKKTFFIQTFAVEVSFATSELLFLHFHPQRIDSFDSAFPLR